VTDRDKAAVNAQDGQFDVPQLIDNVELAADRFIVLLAKDSFGVVLVSFGLAFALVGVVLRTTRPDEWATPEFLGLMAFASLLTVLGCLERLVFTRPERRAGGGTRPQLEKGGSGTAGFRADLQDCHPKEFSFQIRNGSDGEPATECYRIHVSNFVPEGTVVDVTWARRDGGSSASEILSKSSEDSECHCNDLMSGVTLHARGGKVTVTTESCDPK
jgi:hypothetical protein